MAISIPERLRRAAEACGSAGELWLAGLPVLVTRLSQRWGFTVGEPFVDSHVSFTTPVVMSDGGHAVCKIPMSEVILATAAGRARHSEPAALRLWDGDGAARLLELDPMSGAMLLEHCRPGDVFGGVADLDARDEIGADLMIRLWRPARPDMDFIRLVDVGEQMVTWSVDRFEEHAEPFEVSLLDATLEAWQEIKAEPARCVLLHGDFHPDNILSAQREPWLAIDPLPMIGGPAYDAVPFLLYRKGDMTDPRSGWGAAVQRFCDRVELDATRVLAWSLVRLISDALADISQGASAEGMEDFQEDLWSARLIRDVLG